MTIFPKINKQEVLHYLKYNSKDRNKNIDQLIDEMILEVEQTNYKYKFAFYDVQIKDQNVIVANDVVLESKNLSYHLRHCQKIALMGVSLSLESERKLLMYQKTNALKALIYDACASAFVEAICDALSMYFEEEINLFSTTRFSPGYGDLSLETQTVFYKMLHLEKMGVQLTDSLLMIPRKTVTAVVGFTKKRYNKNKVICDCDECTIPCKKWKVMNDD